MRTHGVVDCSVKHDAGLRRVIVAMVAAAVSFCLSSAGLFYIVADVKDAGWRFSGPAALAGEMAGLFGGGLMTVMVLITALRWRRGKRD